MSQTLPPLPFEAWTQTRTTLHLVLQIMGKVRLSLAPRKNHWWYIVEYVSSEGFTTTDIPFLEGFATFKIIFDVHQKELRVVTSTGVTRGVDLDKQPSISSVYSQLMTQLQSLDIEVDMVAKPYDVGIDKPFSDITDFHHYDWEYIHRFWSIYLWVDGVMKEFSGRFYGKTCPVQIYWHHLDIAVTRFSGRKAPPLGPDAKVADKDAYSHEVISFGFWAGDDAVPEPTFYAYAYPSPDGLESQPLLPDHASWVVSNGSPMAVMSYHTLIKSENPRQDLLAFLESSYQAGASLAGWDVTDLTTPDLSAL